MTSPDSLWPSLDRLTQLDEGSHGVAVRNVPSTLDIFNSHFPRFPVLPGVLLLESMTALAMVVSGSAECWRVHAVHGMRLRRFVRPGDQVVVTASVVTASADPAVRDRSAPFNQVELRTRAEVDGVPVATVRRLVLNRHSGRPRDERTVQSLESPGRGSSS